MLSDVNVALGVTGSIAAVKVVELAHELRRRHAHVRAVMTDAATRIIHPHAVEYATNNPVVTELTGAVEHITLCGNDGWADVLLIAPATANTLGKIASATDDTPVTTCATTAFGAHLPVVIAPAMHEPMYEHPGVLDAIDTIQSWGARFVPPRVEESKAKIAAEDPIALELARAAGHTPLEGQHIVVTSGATTEPIDPIRVLTNRASGRTGRAVARACYARGATVTLVHDGPPVAYANVRPATTAADMYDAVLSATATADALVSAAAVSDYTTDPDLEKIRSGEPITLDLRPTPKIIDAVRDAYPTLPIVGFKAEADTQSDDDLTAQAHDLLDRNDLAFVVANTAAVMGQPDTRALLVTPDDTTEITGTKTDLGLRIADELATILT